jgi:hypothetical protein
LVRRARARSWMSAKNRVFEDKSRFTTGCTDRQTKQMQDQLEYSTYAKDAARTTFNIGDRVSYIWLIDNKMMSRDLYVLYCIARKNIIFWFIINQQSNNSHSCWQLKRECRWMAYDCTYFFIQNWLKNQFSL